MTRQPSALSERAEPAPSPEVVADARPGRHHPLLPLLLVILACAVLGVGLRSINLFDAPVRTDEPTITLRAVDVASGEAGPPAFDYPPFANYVLATVLRAAAVVEPEAVSRTADAPYVIGRVLFVAISALGIVLTGLLGMTVAEGRRARWIIGVGAAAAMAVSYLSVRLGNHARPDQIQLVLTVGALLATMRWDREQRTRWLVAACACAGFAAATKYVGGLVVLITLVAVLTQREHGWPDRLRQGALLTVSSMAGFIAGTAGTILAHPASFVDGFTREFSHQAGGHLGYEPDGSAIVFHLTQSLPGNWGWPLTVLAVAGVGWVAWRGSRAERMVAAFALLGMAFAVLTQVRFPHYVLLPLPGLAVMAFIALERVWRVRRDVGVAALVLVTVALLVTTADGIRLGRTLGAPSTQVLAQDLQAPYADMLVVEAYTATDVPRVAALDSLANDPELVRCGCVVAISSYQEDRYRNRPDLYADQIARYDALRAEGQLLGVVGPDRPLPYNWDLLPTWGLRAVPIVGDVGAVGPMISVLRMPPPDS